MCWINTIWDKFLAHAYNKQSLFYKVKVLKIVYWKKRHNLDAKKSGCLS